MLPHHYLRRIADIHKRYKAEVDNLLGEITDPAMKAKILDWEPGDPITDEYPQVDQNAADEKLADIPGAHEHSILSGSILGEPKKDAASDQHLGEVIHTNAAEVKAVIESSEITGNNPADASAQLNHQPQGQPQQQPASGNPPA